jgi:type III secretory pathway component EscT
MTKRYKDSFISLGIILFLVGLSFALFYPSDSKLSKFLGVLIIYFLTIVFAITGGIATIITRPKAKFKYSFTYNFFATLNLTTGLIGLIFAVGEADLFLILIIGSAVLGLLMFNDIYFSKQTSNNQPI